MKQYKYRGWPWVVLIVLMLLYTVIAAIIAHRGHNDGSLSWAPLLTALASSIPQIIEQRRMTEAQWRAQNDERRQTIMGKSALVAWFTGALATVGAILYLALRDPENDTAGILLSVVFLVSALTFAIVMGVLNKKL